ncbi:MAG: GNAT family N-acetyltransferase [Phototrophicaceae bacterium]
MVSQKLQGKTSLRPFEEKHVTEVFALIEDNREFLSQWLDWVDEHTSLEDTLKMMQEAVRQFASKNGLMAGIWYEDRLVGCVGHRHIDWQNHTAKLTFWIAEPYQGAGLVSRSVKSVIQHSFYQLELGRLEIECGIDNERAIQLAERLGFMREGILRNALWLQNRPLDKVIYGLLREDWAAQQSR